MVVLAAIVVFVVMKKKKNLSASSDLDPDSDVAETPEGEAKLAKTQGIDVNAPGWRAMWRAEKKRLKRLGVSKAEIKAAKGAIKQGKVKKGDGSGAGWSLAASITDTTSAILGGKLSK